MKFYGFKKIYIIFTVLVYSFVCSNSLKAQQIATDSTLTNHLKTIEMMLSKDKVSTDTWWWGWLAGYSAATVVQVAIGLGADKLSTKQDMYLSATTTLLGAAGQIITPVMPSKALVQLALLPERTPEEKSQKLKLAEELLEKRAKAELEGKGWQTHAMCSAVNLGSGLITWFGFKRTWKDGLINFAINSAVTEAQIWSQPLRAKKEFEYYKKTSSLSTGHLSSSHQYFYAVSAGLQGICLKIRF